MGKTYVKVSGTWKQVKKTYVKVNGVWKSCQKVYVKVNGVWKDVTGGGDRGVFGGGGGGGDRKAIYYITISSLGDASYFGDLISPREAFSATSNGTNDRGVFSGDYWNTALSYITISVPSNAVYFGDMLYEAWGVAATSNGTNDRGLFGGGQRNDQYDTILFRINYVTISTPSNVTYFGNLRRHRYDSAATSNGTNDRGLFGGGVIADGTWLAENYAASIDYVTISTLANARRFGYLTQFRARLGATSNGTNDRGVFGGGFYETGYSTGYFYSTTVRIIDYVTISTLSDASTFGNLLTEEDCLAATSNGTNDRGVFGGGNGKTLEYITISTTSNSHVFGNLPDSRWSMAATSNA